MKATDAAWTAGLFDGEGHVWYRFNESSGTLGVSLRMRMTDDLAVERFASVFSAESINVVTGETILPSGKVLFMAQISGFSDFVAAAKHMLPHLTTKRVLVSATAQAVMSIQKHPVRSSARRCAHRSAYEQLCGAFR